MPGSNYPIRPLHHMHWWTDVHRSAAVNTQLGICLSFIAGAANAGGFLAVGQYTSHMTGLLSSVADNLVLGHWALIAASLAAVAAFLAGAMTTAMMINWGLRRQLRSSYARPLALESALLLVFGLAGTAINQHAELFAPLTVLLLCYMMGLQNAVITKISSAEIRTTHVTGLITDIGIEVGKLLYYNRSPAPTKVVANRRKLRIHLALVAAFFIGGLLGALGFKFWGYITTAPLAFLLGLLISGPLLHDLRQGRFAPDVPPR